MRRRLRLLLAALLVSLACLLLRALARARDRAVDVPLSPVTAGPHVGPDFPERAGLTTGTEPAGEMDDMDAYARPDFDLDRVHPAVRHFYEHTGDYRMTATATWHCGFRFGAALAARLTAAIEQLNLPGPREDATVPLVARFADVKSSADPRDGARAWVRTNADTGAAVFVALYGSHTARTTGTESDADASAGSRNAERFVNVAVPLPGSNLSTVLRIEHAGGDPDATGIDLTTCQPGDPGLYLYTPWGAFDLPLEQRFSVRPTADGIAATQTMWVFGLRFLTIEYDATPADDS